MAVPSGKMGKRILFVEPPFFRLHHNHASLNRVPLSLAYLAGMVLSEKPDWRVHIYNADFSPRDFQLDLGFLSGPGFHNYRENLTSQDAPVWKEIRRTVQRVRPSVVGISMKSQNAAAAVQVARIVKSLDPETVVIVGGPHPSLLRADVLKDPEIDLAVFGEGEETILEVLEALEGRRPFSTVRGLAYTQGGRRVLNPPRPLIRDLDVLPFSIRTAFRTLIDFDAYPKEAFRYVFAVRGCPFQCSFCGSHRIWGRKVRFRSPGHVIEEIRGIRDFGIRTVHFDDDTFGVKRSYILALCHSLRKHCPGLRWSCEMHVKLVEASVVKAMREAGCWSIQMGIESGNNHVLKEIGKGITIQEAFQAARTIKKEGIFLQAFFMAGFPQETESTLDDTIRAAKAFPADQIIYSLFTPYMGTVLFEECRRIGLVGPDFDPSLYHHQGPANHFCPQIPGGVFKERTRALAQWIEKSNNRKRIRAVLSGKGFWKLTEIGLRRSARRLMHTGRRALFNN